MTVVADACAPGLFPIQPAPTTPPPTSAFSQSTSESATFSGDTGTVETFTLTAGTYVINQTAEYDAAKDPSGTGQCHFAGELDNLTTGNSAPLGSSAGPILPSTPLETTTKGTLSTGTFKLEIYPGTTCDWDVTIVGSNG